MQPNYGMPPSGAPGAQAGAVNYGMPPGAPQPAYGMPPAGAPGAQAGAPQPAYGMPPSGAPGAQAGAPQPAYGMPPAGAPGAQAGAPQPAYGMPPAGAPGAQAGACAPGARAGALPGAQAGAPQPAYGMPPAGAPGAQAGAPQPAYGMPPTGAPGAQAGAVPQPAYGMPPTGAPGAQAGAPQPAYGMPPTGAPGAQAGAVPGAHAGAPQPGYGMPPAGAPGAQAGAVPQYGMPPAGGAHAGAPQPGYGMPGQPAYGQPMPGQYPPQQMPGQPAYGMPGQPAYGQPMPGQPMPGQPAYGGMPPAGQPMYGQPMPGQPMYGQPMPGQPMYGQPMPGQPAYGMPPAGQPMYGQPMHGQPMPGGAFNPAQDAKRLREAMKGIGTRDSVLIDIIGHRTREQRVMIRQEYSRTLHRDLMKDLSSETSGNYRYTLLKLMLPRDEMLAEIAHDAMEGIGTRDSVLIDIITQFPYELPSIMAAYQRRYGKSLDAAVKSETSGSYGKLLNALITTRRPPPTMVDHGRAVSDADIFYRAGEGRIGTDERTYIAIIAGNSQAQLQLMDQEYRRTHPKGMLGAIKSETSGHFKEALLACMTPTEDYFAQRINDSVVGAGTSDFSLITAFLVNERPQLQRVAQAYQSRYGKLMAKRVADDISGDYKRLLMALLN